MSKPYLHAASLIVLCVSLAHGQNTPPKDTCDYAGDTPAYTLEERVGIHPAILYQVCKTAAVCGTGRMQAGRPIEVYRTEGGWSCGYYASSKGAGPAWVQSALIRPVPFYPDPSPHEWLGVWKGGASRVTVTPAKLPDRLMLRGKAYWQGLGDNVHFGDFSGEAVPVGNKLHFVENADGEGCVVDMALYGRYIIASDNMGCGGMNVRFQGIWRRSSRLPQAKKRTS